MPIARSVVYAGLTLTAVVLTMLVRPGSIQTSYARSAEIVSIQLTGPVRDFRRDHPDFGVTPSAGVGHYALTVSDWLGDTPTRGENGYKVADQTTDINGRNIAPHLAGSRPTLGGGNPLGIRVLETVVIEDEAVIDAYNSGRGAYGFSGNYGRTAYLSTNSDAAGSIEVEKKAVVKADLDVGPFGDPDLAITGEGIFVGEKGNLSESYEIATPSYPQAHEIEALEPKLTVVGTMTLTGDTNPDDDKEPLALHYGQIELKKDATLEIVGDLIVICDGRFKMDEATIEVTPGASLSLFVDGDIEIKSTSTVTVADPTSAAVSIFATGNHDLTIEGQSHVIASIIAPDRELDMKDAHLYGSYLGRALRLQKKAGIHVDDATAEMGNYNFAVTVNEKLELKEVTYDAFDSDKGNYSGTNSGIGGLLMTNATKKGKVKVKDSSLESDILVGLGADPNEVIEVKKGAVSGTTASMATPATIPVVMAPPAGPSLGRLKMKSQTLTLSGEKRYDDIDMDKSILRISGDVTLRVDGDLKLESSHIQLLPNSTLTVYIHKSLELKDDSTINAWGNPQRVSIRRTSVKKGKVKVEDDSVLSAWVQGAKTKMEVKKGGVFLGSFAGEEFKADKATVIVDMAGLRPCIAVDDTAGTRSFSSSGAISSDASFRQWFIDDPWANVSRPYTITLARNGAGVYEYIEPAFYPIDGGMFGNDGDPHNYYFTYEIDAYFEYNECGGGFVEFRGGDGCWIYIDGQMAIDLGGVGAPQNQRIDVDRLGLTDGTHRLQLFYAQRTAGDTPFELRTNLLLDSQDFMPLSLQFD